MLPLELEFAGSGCFAGVDGECEFICGECELLCTVLALVGDTPFIGEGVDGGGGASVSGCWGTSWIGGEEDDGFGDVLAGGGGITPFVVEVLVIVFDGSTLQKKENLRYKRQQKNVINMLVLNLLVFFWTATSVFCGVGATHKHERK